MPSLKIIFAGSGHFGLPTLQSLHTAGHNLVQIISQPDRPAGRGRKLTPTPIAQFALDHNLPLLRPEKISSLLNSPPPTQLGTGNWELGTSPSQLGTRNSELETFPLPPCDVMVVIAFGQKIPDAIVNHPRLGSVNLHASLLPKYRGAAPINHAVVQGETITGNSVIRLAQKMDAGAVLAQSTRPITQTITAGELHDLLSDDGPPLVLKVIDQLATGAAQETPQDESLATLAPKLSRQSTLIDWTQSAAKISRQINGLSPWPGCRVRLLDASGTELTRLTLLRAEPAPHNDTHSRWHPGELTTYGLIRTADHALEILELQPESKRPMSLPDFRRGHPWQPGLRLESLT